MNRLLFGDNLTWLRDKNLFPDASIDLVYLDPPFNSNASYNVLFKEASGEASQAQFHAFTDTWEWTADVDATYPAPCPQRAGSSNHVLSGVEGWSRFTPYPIRGAEEVPQDLAHDGLPCNDSAGFIMKSGLTPSWKWLSSFFLIIGLSSCTEPGTDIFQAVAAGNVRQVRQLLGSDPKLASARDRHGSTPLHWAAWCGRTEVAQLLITSGADTMAHAPGIGGETPLHQTCSGTDPTGRRVVQEQRQVAEVLLGGGADVNARRNDGATPLHSAVFYENKVIVELLLAKGADVNAKDEWGLTPLHYAAKKQASEMNEQILADIGELLIRTGAKVDAKDNSGRTPLRHAITTGKGTVAELLKKHGAID